MDDRARDAVLPRVIPAALEPEVEADLLAPVRFGPGEEDQQLVQGPENTTGLDRRDLSRTGIAFAGRANFGPGSDCAARIHRDGHWRVSIRRPEHRTVFVSTHLIAEFEGLIDEFTIIEQGRELFSMEADSARDRFRKIRARFAGPLPAVNLPGRWT